MCSVVLLEVCVVLQLMLSRSHIVLPSTENSFVFSLG